MGSSRHAPAVLALSASVLLAPAGSGAGGAGEIRTRLFGLGHHASSLELNRFGAVFTVPEAQSGEADWNGDGDRLDEVLFLADPRTGAVQGTGLACIELELEGRYAAFLCPEPSQGAFLNGDDDQEDDVLHVLDLVTGEVWNSGLQALVLALSDGLVVAGVQEREQGGVDRNGDGDATDLVMARLDVAARVVQNLALASRVNTSFVPEVVGDGGRFSFLVSELHQGGVDLNDDEDLDDQVTHWVDRDGLVHSTGLASLLGLEMAAGELLLIAHEQGQGEDLNGNGSEEDDLLVELDLETGTWVVFGIPVGVSSLGHYVTDGTTTWRHVYEGIVGEDLNGDGDTTDRILHHGPAGSGLQLSLGWATAYEEAYGGRLHFGVLELQNRVDLNGDGDVFDTVAFVHDPAAGTLLNLGVAVDLFHAAWNPTGNGVLLRAFESSDGETDYNGDGDAEDVVPLLADVTTGEIESLALALQSNGTLERRRGVVGITLDEAGQGVDANGDGDHADSVPVLLDLWTRRVTSLGLATESGVQSGGIRMAADLLAFRANEADQGQDLNGDGDTDDLVAFAGTFEDPLAPLPEPPGGLQVAGSR